MDHHQFREVAAFETNLDPFHRAGTDTRRRSPRPRSPSRAPPLHAQNAKTSRFRVDATDELP